MLPATHGPNGSATTHQTTTIHHSPTRNHSEGGKGAEVAPRALTRKRKRKSQVDKLQECGTTRFALGAKSVRASVVCCSQEPRCSVARVPLPFPKGNARVSCKATSNQWVFNRIATRNMRRTLTTRKRGLVGRRRYLLLHNFRRDYYVASMMLIFPSIVGAAVNTVVVTIPFYHQCLSAKAVPVATAPDRARPTFMSRVFF